MRLLTLAAVATLALLLILPAGCSTAPKAEDEETFLADANTATRWFQNNVVGLRSQMNDAAAYIIFPSVGQWGIIFAGGQFGRGMLARPDGTQIGWAAINTGSIGLQAGVRGFKMLLVIQNEETVNKFKANQLSGAVAGVVVVAEEGTSGQAPFSNGVAMYQGASTGLMAGVNIGLDYIRYKPMGEE